MPSSIFTCPKCEKVVSENAKSIECFRCSNWFHLKCAGISKEMFNLIFGSSGSLKWSCQSCVSTNTPTSDSRGLQNDVAVAIGELKTALISELKLELNAFLVNVKSELKTELIGIIKERIASEVTTINKKIENFQMNFEKYEDVSTISDRLTRTDTTVERLDKSHRRHDIIIQGLPGNIDDMKGFFLKICEILNYPLKQEDMAYCIKLRGGMLAKFSNVFTRDMLMSKYFKKKNLKLSEIIGGSVHSRVYFNDNLPPLLGVLKRKCLALKKCGKILGVGSVRGTVFIKLHDGYKKKINVEEDLSSLTLSLN